MNEFTVRMAVPEDAESLLAIYAPYIRETCITFEYEVPSVREFRSRMEEVLKSYPWLVCEQDGGPAAYAYAHRYMTRAAYQWDAELSVYTDRNRTGQGIGRALYTALMEILKLQNVKNVYGIVTSPNPPSEALHYAMGFSLMGVSRKTGFKQGHWIDVSWFERSIASLAEAPGPLLKMSEADQEKIRAILLSAQRQLNGRTGK